MQASVAAWRHTGIPACVSSCRAGASPAILNKMATTNGRPTNRARSPDVYLRIRRAYHRTIIRQMKRWNTGLWPVRPAGMLPASRVSAEGMLPALAFNCRAGASPAILNKMATTNGRPTNRARSPDVHLRIRRAYHRTIIRQIERFLKFH
jgi:hypothetical protein